MNINIQKFLSLQTCASICCIDKDNKPYCFSCYFAFNEDDGLLYFKSSLDSHHVGLLLENPAVAITVLPDTLNKLAVKGVQMQGLVLNLKDSRALAASTFYHKRNPMAYAIKGTVFSVRIDVIKMTDSSRVFGKKLCWERGIPEVLK